MYIYFITYMRLYMQLIFLACVFCQVGPGVCPSFRDRWGSCSESRAPPPPFFFFFFLLWAGLQAQVAREYSSQARNAVICHCWCGFACLTGGNKPHIPRKNTFYVFLFFFFQLVIFHSRTGACSSLPFLSLLRGKEIHLQKEMQSIPPFLKEAV